MAEIDYARLGVILPTKNVEKFRQLFDGVKESNGRKRKFFGCTLTDFKIMESNTEGMSAVIAQFECPWSVEIAMTEEHGKDMCNDFVTIDDAVSELDIQIINGQSYQEEADYTEFISFTRGGDKKVYADYDTDPSYVTDENLINLEMLKISNEKTRNQKDSKEEQDESEM